MKSLDNMQSKRPVILIDGTNLAYKFCCAPYKNFSHNGVGTGVVYGFLTFLCSMSTMYPMHERVIVVWDTDAQLVKKKDDLSYKANRVHDDSHTFIFEQIKMLRHILPMCGVVSLAKDGYEADDLANTYVQQNKNKRIILVSSDHDYIALISENVSLFDWRNKNKKMVPIPDYNYHIYHTLVGDKGDNIKSLKRFSHAHALELAKKYTSIDELLKHENFTTEEKRTIKHAHELAQMLVVDGVEFETPQSDKKKLVKTLLNLGFGDTSIDKISKFAR